MRFLKVRLVSKSGGPGGYYWVVPSKVVGVTDALVPGELKGPREEPIAMHKAAIDLGGNLLVVDLLPEDIVKKLEEILDEDIKKVDIG